MKQGKLWLSRTFLSFSSAAALIVFIASGCSVYMAAHQPDEKDLSVLNRGTPRMQVIAELGTPSFSEEKNGKRAELYMFKQGYSSGNKMGRAFFHGAADVVTLGLWEIIATPTESYASGTDMSIEVIYDATDKVETYQVLRGMAEPVEEESEQTEESEE